MMSGSDSIYSPDKLAELAGRLERFDRTRDPAELWPGLTPSARVAAAREIERVTRAVLAGAASVRVDPAQLHHPYALSVAAHTTGMGPLLGRWAEDGLVDAAPSVRAYLDAHLLHARRRADRIEREILPVFDAFIARGITPLVFKGFGTARQYFEEPGVRRMSDVDLLVDPDRVENAKVAMKAAAFWPTSPALIPYKQEWIGEGVDERIFSVELSDERTKWVVELHASLDRIYHPGAVARLDVARSRSETLVVADRQVQTLAPAATLLVLACHCSQELGSSRLLRVVEIVRVIRSGRLDWGDFLDLLRQSGASRYAYPALALAEDLAPGSVDPRALALGLSESTFAARHTVKRLVPAGSSGDELGLLRQIMWMRGPMSILHRAFRFVWPATIGTRPSQMLPSWRIRLRLLRAGLLSIRAPDERRPVPPVSK